MGLILISSCKKNMEELNINPDTPVDVPINVRLAAIESVLSYSVGGDLSRHTSIYTQQMRGVSRQWAVIQNYGIIGEDVNRVWGDNLYADVLLELKLMKEKAEEGGYVHYNGVAKALEAYTLMTMTDLWGDMPYSEAFQGVDNLQPSYDSQEAIYSTINTLLSESKAHLAATDGGAIVPGSDDFIYGGSIADWTGFVSMLKARYFLHLGIKDASNYQNALTELSSGGLVSDAKYKFPGGANAAPMYQFNDQRGDIEISNSFASLLGSLNDPRDTNLYNQPFTTSHSFFTDNQSIVLMSTTEQLFIEAECTFNTSGASAAHPIYLSAIQSSLDDYGMSADYSTYVGQASVDPGATNLTLEDIMNQKYIALFTSPELFNDLRRTGFPTLIPNTGTQIPNRFPYPQAELDLNSNTPSGVTIYSKVWWQN